MKAREIAKTEARKLATKIGVAAYLILVVFMTLALMVDSYRDAREWIASNETHLSRMLEIGDLYQIRSLMSSVEEGGSIRRYELRTLDGSAIQGSKESSEKDENLPGMFSRVLDFEVRSVISDKHGAQAVLSIWIPIPVFQFIPISLISLFLFFAIFYLLQKSFGKLSERFVTPLEVVAKKVESIGAESPNESSFAVEELENLYGRLKEFFIRMKESEAQKREMEKDAALSRLASRVAHDIRSPVGTLKLLLAGDSTLAEDKYLMKAAVERIEMIARDLLQNRRSLQVGPSSAQSLASVIRKSLSLKSVEVQNQGVMLRSSVAPELENVPASAIDCSTLDRVMSNLVNNAVDVSELGDSVFLVARLSQPNHFELEVRDQGGGFDAQVLESLDAGPIVSTKPHGNALGLSSARDFANSLGGRLRVENIAGGAKLSLRVPLSLQ